MGALNADFFLGLAFGGAVLGYAAYSIFSEDKDSERPKVLRRITAEDLKNYSGEGHRACYVALNGDIYNVTKKKDIFIRANLAGKVLNDPKEVSCLVPEFVHLGLSANQIKRLFPKVGELLIMQEFTAEDLKMYDGRGDMPAYICAKGMVFDVDKEFYGPDAPYGAFAGRDASRALAKVSLEKEDLENTNIEDLNWSERQTLEEWVAKFETKYIKVGTLKK